MKTIKKSFRKLLPIICSLLWLSNIQAQSKGENILIIHDAVCKPDTTVVIYLEVVNEDHLFGIQVDLPLPAGFSYVSGSAWLNPARKGDFIIVQQNILPGTNTLRIISISYSNGHFQGNRGIIATFNLNVPTQADEYLLIPDLVMLGGAMGSILTDTFDGTVFVASQGSVTGDANCDGLVNVMDVVITIQYILGNIPKPFCFANADLDGNLLVNVADVVGTVSIILSSSK